MQKGGLYNEILVIVPLAAFLLCHMAGCSLSNSRFVFHEAT